MLDEDHSQDEGAAEELLRRALLDDSSAVAVSLRIGGLPLSEAMTVIFHGRPGPRHAPDLRPPGAAEGRVRRCRPASCCAFPCDLDLRRCRRPRGGGAVVRGAGHGRCATRWSAPTRCSTSGASPLRDQSPGVASRSTTRSSFRSGLPAPRLIPTAAGGHRITARGHARCAAARRTLRRRGRPPMGNRLRAAGPDSGVSVGRRSRALCGGLPGAGRRATRWALGRAARAPGSVGTALHGAKRQLIHGRGATRARPCAAAPSLLLIGLGILVFPGGEARCWRER